MIPVSLSECSQHRSNNTPKIFEHHETQTRTLRIAPAFALLQRHSFSACRSITRKVPRPRHIEVFRRRRSTLTRWQLRRRTALVPTDKPTGCRARQARAPFAQPERTAPCRQRASARVIRGEIREALFPSRSPSVASRLNYIRVGLEIPVGANSHERKRRVVAHSSQRENVARCRCSRRRVRRPLVSVHRESEFVTSRRVVLVVGIRRLSVEDNGGRTLGVEPAAVADELAAAVRHEQIQPMVLLVDQTVGPNRGVGIGLAAYEPVNALGPKRLAH